MAGATTGDVDAFFAENGIRWVDLHFTDLPGTMQHVTIPAKDFTEASFAEGFGKLDGSSIRGFTSIFESDMVLMPVRSTLRKVPWTQGLARVICEVHWGADRGRFEKDPRAIAEAAEAFGRSLGYKSFFGPELEFFIFDRVDVDVSSPHGGTGYRVTAREAPWSSNGGYSIRFREGYYPAPPIDKMMELRMQIVNTLTDGFGFDVEAHHHEVATAGQGEIDFRFTTLTDAADKAGTLKYVARNVAAANNAVATFMPKPLYGDNGSGMHVHMSLWDLDGNRNMMYDASDSYAELSQTGRYAVGGLLLHARAISAIASPTVNSYRRLIPGFEAPVYLAWSRSNRSAVVRVPAYQKGSEKSKRIEYRAPDGSSNPYLTLSAMLCAALDGIRGKADPGAAAEENIYEMSPERRAREGIKEVPRSLDEALDALESDHEFLKPVFNKEILDQYVSMKRAEAKALAAYPHPVELYYYLDT